MPLLHRIDDGRREIGIERRQALLVAARRLLLLRRWDLKAEVAKQRRVDILARLVVPSHGDHNGRLPGQPSHEKPVSPIEMTTADVIKHRARKPVAACFAPAVA